MNNRQNDFLDFNDNQIINNLEFKEHSNHDKKQYPKESDDVIKLKKKTVSCHSKFLKNPDLSFFNNDSQFIYDIDEGINYIQNRENPNSLKLTQEEKENLLSIIRQIKIEQAKKNGEQLIIIDKYIADKLNTFSEVKSSKDPLTNYIKNQFSKMVNVHNLTCRKLSCQYFKDTGIKVSKSKVHKIIRHLGYRYLKTTIKNNNILTEEHIISSLAFIKIVQRCLKLKIKLIYVDESSILSTNNNYRIWRFPNQEIFMKTPKKERINLIMGVSDSEVIHYCFNKENTNEKNFADFILSLNEKIKDKGISSYAIILDNLSSHKTKTLIKLYINKKMNIIYNSPYQSTFNSIELAFRSLKKYLYSKIFETMDKVIEESSSFINSDSFQNTLKLNFKETIEKYINFSEKYKFLNLKNLKYKIC
jgi:transposase